MESIKIYYGIANGKTTELIRQSNKNWYYILCASREQAEHIVKMAKSMNIDIPYPITVSELPLSPGANIKGILIDEVEQVLQHLIRKPIISISTSGEIETIGFRGRK